MHGFASGPSSGKAQWFRRQLAARNVELEVLDLTNGDFEHLTISSQLQVLARTARKEPVALIGSSMGGYLAALYASENTEVRRLVLLAPAFRFLHRWTASLGAECMGEWKRAGRMDVFHYGENRLMPLCYDLIEDAAAYHEEPSFEQPALIFHGRRDDVVPAEYSEEYASKHANVTLRLLDSDHQLTDVVETIWLEAAPFLLRE